MLHFDHTLRGRYFMVQMEQKCSQNGPTFKPEYSAKIFYLYKVAAKGFDTFTLYDYDVTTEKKVGVGVKQETQGNGSRTATQTQT